ncbi:PrsW family intramembrane metalloprotease [Kitasatospora sp. LaBMicrA B282]|uniref:PrsW family intramembrane metalloprotease n=1 Tax=Kitasatospora sp. LaBMicrA B282 TaxID=3420949 RepID=UPI003D11C526
MNSWPRVRAAGPTAAAVALAGNAVLLVHLVQAQTGTTGLLVGLGLALLPLPVVLAALTWLNQRARVPTRRLVLCLVWGSCAATTMAMLANGWASETLSQLQGSARGDALGADVASPLIEETAKGAVLLLTMVPPLRRRARAAGRGPTPLARARLRHTAVATGLVLGGFSACGFAFTENVLYLGRAFTDDQRQRLEDIGLGLSPSLRDYDDTVRTFVLRALLSPFAHPLFTALTGLGLAIALTSRRRAARLAAPLGLLAATALHGGWNAAASLGTHGFLLVYAALMVPCFAALAGLALWARGRPAARAPVTDFPSRP